MHVRVSHTAEIVLHKGGGCHAILDFVPIKDNAQEVAHDPIYAVVDPLDAMFVIHQTLPQHNNFLI